MCNLGAMANEASKYFMGDVYAADVGVGFLARDNRGGSTDPTIDEATARAIVAASDRDPNVSLSPVNLFEISQEEFDLYCDSEMQGLSLPDGLTLFQVKR